MGFRSTGLQVNTDDLNDNDFDLFQGTSSPIDKIFIPANFSPVENNMGSLPEAYSLNTEAYPLIINNPWGSLATPSFFNYFSNSNSNSGSAGSIISFDSNDASSNTSVSRSSVVSTSSNTNEDKVSVSTGGKRSVLRPVNKRKAEMVEKSEPESEQELEPEAKNTEDKKRDRNKLSALNYRTRKKLYIQGLEDKVIILESRLSALEEENRALVEQNEALLMQKSPTKQINFVSVDGQLHKRFQFFKDSSSPSPQNISFITSPSGLSK